MALTPLPGLESILGRDTLRKKSASPDLKAIIAEVQQRAKIKDKAQRDDIPNALGIKYLDGSKSNPLQTFDESMRKRIDSYLRGAEIVLENHFDGDPISKGKYLDLLETQKTKIKGMVDARGKAGKLDKNDFKKVMAVLTEFIQLSTIMEQETAFEALVDAENINCWETPTPIQVTEYTRDDGKTVVQVSRPITNLTNEQALDYMNIYKDSAAQPLWFKKLDPWHQNYLQGKLKDVHEAYKNIQPKPSAETLDTPAMKKIVGLLNDTLGSPPSTVRNYPGLANYSEHTLIVLDKDGEVEFTSTRQRGSSSTVNAVKVDGDTAYDEERAKLTTSSVAQLVTKEALTSKLQKFEDDW